MSLLTAIILPMLEKQLINAKPDIAEFAIRQLRDCAADIIVWAEKKINMDINGDGIIGAPIEEKKNA